MPTLKPLHILAFLLTLILFSQASSATQKEATCGFQGAHEVPAASLYITSSTDFDQYRYLLVDTVKINGSQLSTVQQEVLREMIQHTVEQKWHDYLGWRRTESAGTDVARLKIQVSALSKENTLKIDTLLSDSVSDRQLMAQCNTSLELHPKMVAIDSTALYHQISRWGSDLGSHIMVAY